MALRFNVPPNWPEPPEGWVPQPGWQPDPAWGPAPDGWNFWVEDTEDDATRLLSESSPLADEAGTNVSEAPSSDFGSEEESDKTKALPYQQVADTLSAHVEQASQQDSSSPQEYDSASVQADSSSAQSADTSYAGTSGAAASYNLNGINYQAGASSQADSSYQAGASYQPGQYQNQNPYAAQAPQANPYAPQTDPAKKKNFFATTGGILTIIGIILLVLIVGAVVAVSMFFNAVRNSAETSYSYSYSSGSDSDSDSDSNSSVNAVQGTTNGSVLEFSGEGKKALDVSQRSNADQPAWVEFELTPSDDSYNSIIVQGFDSSDDTSEVFALSGKDGSEVIKGSVWMDAEEGYYEDTAYLVVDGSGKWTVKVHPASDAPAYGKGETVKGNAPTAFVYKGGEAKVKVKFTSPKEDTDSFTLQAFNSDIKGFASVANGDGAEYESSNTINYSGSTPMVMDNSFAGSWEITFE